MKASKNLTKHIQLLKEEQNLIIVKKRNGDYINLEELKSLNEHRKYTQKLLQKEKKEYFNGLLKRKKI